MSRSLPIAVDLDGTLVNTDLLFEALFRLLKNNPFYFFVVPFWLLKGKVYLKSQLAQRVDLDLDVLPYNENLIDYLKQEKAQGRKLVLATASHVKFAQAVSGHVAIFDEVLATQDRNMKARNKAEALVEKFGEKGFCYAGNESVDLEVWKRAGASIVVSPDKDLASRADAVAPNEWVHTTAAAGLPVYVRACRMHQWVKNLLVFVPLLASGRVLETTLILQSIGAFFAFGFCASSVYLLNDLLDLEADRRHKTKKLRPFAAGALPLAHGIVLIPTLLLSAIFLASLLPLEFAIALLVYYVATTAYSFHIKRKVVVDVIVLAGLYTCRIVAGGAASGVPISEWLLAFSLFIFLSLAILKRYIELIDLRNRNEKNAAPGRGYSVNDIELLSSLGGASGYISVLVFALYLNSEIVRSLYENSVVLWGVCPLLLYWISRAWILAHRGEMNDDPIVFAIKDRASQLVGVMVLSLFLLAQL
jgi:4-hydroxybenzoate polyprenyltransferase